MRGISKAQPKRSRVGAQRFARWIAILASLLMSGISIPASATSTLHAAAPTQLITAQLSTAEPTAQHIRTQPLKTQPLSTQPLKTQPRTITDIPLTGTAVVSQAAISWQNGFEELLIYTSDIARDPSSDSTSVIFVPVPNQAHAQLVSSDIWEDLAHIFHPQILQFNAHDHPAAWFHNSISPTEDGGPAEGVGGIEFIRAESAVFGHDQPDALATWLVAKNAEPSADQSRILGSYFTAGWSVAVLSVPPGQAVTWQLSYQSPEPVFPLRAINPLITTSTGQFPLAVIAPQRMERNDAGAAINPATTVISHQLSSDSHELRPQTLTSALIQNAIDRADVVTAMVLPRVPRAEQEKTPDLSFAAVAPSPPDELSSSPTNTASSAALVWILASTAVIAAVVSVIIQVQRRRRKSAKTPENQPQHPSPVINI